MIVRCLQGNYSKENHMLLGIERYQEARAQVTQKTIRIIMSITLLVSLSACSDGGMSDLENYVNSVRSRPASRIAPLPEFKTYETFAYSASNLRDPFVMFENEAELAQSAALNTSGPQPDTKRNKETLEQYPLDTLRFVGQLEKDNEQWAIITSPDSLVHRVKAGNYIGQNFGKITQISESQIEITELVPDGMGGWIKREAALSLGE